MSSDDLTSEEQRRLLENFVYSNDDLERLEGLLAGFNIFDAVGMKHQEIRHSRTLSFLLCPQNGHGLGPHFLKRVLKRIALEAQNTISVVDVDIANFADVETRCEWKNIDILILCPAAKLIVAIENKVLADEHGDQLSRYKKVLDDRPEWAGYQKLFVFLTVDGHSPASEEDGAHWCSASYEMIAEELSHSHKALSGRLGVDQDVLIRHYVDLLRRSVLEDSDIAKLARKIYRAHKGALDIIFEHRPDLRSDIQDYLQRKVEGHSGIYVTSTSGGFVRFAPNSWSFSPAIEAANKGFRPAYVAFEFEIDSKQKWIRLALVIGNIPAPQREELRERIAAALDFTSSRRNTGFPRGWQYKDLEIHDVAPSDIEELFRRIDEWWRTFTEEHLSSITPKVAGALGGV